MATRTTSFIVGFASPFLLPGFETPQPPGEYHVEQDEETIEGISWLAWRRVATFIYLPAVSVAGTASQLVRVDPTEFEAVLEKDREGG